jgi:hypothetical protein
VRNPNGAEKIQTSKITTKKTDKMTNSEIIKELELTYLDYVNYFIPIEIFAEFYQISVEKSEILINAGRKANKLNSKIIKE